LKPCAFQTQDKVPFPYFVSGDDALIMSPSSHHSHVQVLMFLDRALESTGNFDEEQCYSRSVEIEPRDQQNRSRSKSFAKISWD